MESMSEESSDDDEDGSETDKFAGLVLCDDTFTGLVDFCLTCSVEEFRGGEEEVFFCFFVMISDGEFGL